MQELSQPEATSNESVEQPVADTQEQPVADTQEQPAADTQEQAKETATEENSVKLKDTQEVLDLLVETFPVCFSADGDAKPLKIGIFKDLAERMDGDERVSRTMLRVALRKYTSSWRYLRCMKEGVQRVDLDGKDVEVVEAEHVEHASTKLDESKKKAAANRKKPKGGKPRKPGGQGKGDFKRRDGDAASKDGKMKLNRGRRGDKPQVDVKVKKSRAPAQVGLFEGKRVRFSMGKTQVAGTIKEINNDDVVIETFSGMTIKTEKKNII